MQATNAQDLTSHRWQERILLVISEDTSQVDFKKQLSELNQHQPELKERKLIIYQLTPTNFHVGLGDENWEKGNALYKKYKDPSAPFQVILIGLDGGEKIKKKEFFPTNDLFSVIDGMPMRKAEINKKGK